MYVGAILINNAIVHFFNTYLYNLTPTDHVVHVYLQQIINYRQSHGKVDFL